MDVGQPDRARGSLYILVLAGCLVLCLGAMAAFNIAVDPYKYMNTAPRDGFNARKTTIFFHLNVTKSYAFRRGTANNLILGTSRAGRGIAPDHPSLAGDSFYNFATPGSLPGLDYLKLQAAIERGDITRALFFIDFFSFNTEMPLPPGFIEEFGARLSPPRSPRALRQGLADFSAYFWSYRSLADSARTVREQAAAEQGLLHFTTLHDGGRWDVNFPPDRNILQAFQGLERSYLRGNWFPQDKPRFSLREHKDSRNPSFSDFRRLLALAQQHDIDLTLVMLPVHARLLENLDRAGLWPNFESWKRRVVELNEAVAAEQGRAAYAIWDFNGYNAFATEPVTRDTVYGELQWMHDSGHLTEAAGNRVLESVAAGLDTELGARINGDNIEQWLAEQRQLRERYREANPETVRQVRVQVQRTRQRYPWEVDPVSG